MNSKNVNKAIGIFLLVIIVFSSFNCVISQTPRKIVNRFSESSESVRASVAIIDPESNTIPDNEISKNRSYRSSRKIVIAHPVNNSTISKQFEEQTLDEKIREYRKVLNIPRSRWVKTRLVKKLLERRQTNYKNYERIVKAVKIFRTIESKEAFLEELLGMDKKFVDRFTEELMKSREKMEEQIRDYINLVRTRKQVKLTVSRLMLKRLLSKEITTKDFIDFIWKNL